MTGYIYHVIKASTAEVLDQTSIDEYDIELAKDLFCNEFGWAKDYAAGNIAIVFSHTEEEEDFDEDEDLESFMAELEGKDAEY